MIGAVLTIIGPNQLSRITDLISDGLMTGIDLSAVAKVGGVLLAIYLIGEVCGYIEQYIMATVTLDLSKKMRRDLSDKINKVPMKCFGKISHGDILSRVTNDVSTLQQALSNSLPSMISAVAQFVGCLIMMLVTEWRMALAAIAITLIGFVVMAVIMSRSQNTSSPVSRVSVSSTAMWRKCTPAMMLYAFPVPTTRSKRTLPG